MKLKKKTSIQMPLEDKILNAVVWVLMILLTIVVLPPLFALLATLM